MILSEFKKLPIVGILRGIEKQHVAPLVETVISSGLKTIEITMNTPGACALIRATIESAQGRLTVGAGTVLSIEDLRKAVEAGATFIVSPTLVPEVVETCVDKKIPVFPGALTPQEIHNAWQAGATMVKVFPAKVFGPSYFKMVKGPLDKVELLACGGVTADNVSEYFLKGASAVTFGAGMFRKEWIAEGKYERIGQAVKEFIHVVQERKQAYV